MSKKIAILLYWNDNLYLIKMKKLTKAEEEVMQIIWELGPCTVSDIRTYIHENMNMSKPPHSTISTIVRGLDNQEGNKGFLGF